MGAQGGFASPARKLHMLKCKASGTNPKTAGMVFECFLVPGHQQLACVSAGGSLLECGPLLGGPKPQRVWGLKLRV